MVEHIASMQTFTDTGVRPQFENPEAEAFYRTAVDEMNGLGLPFLLAGTYAVSAYTGISRITKDLDIFCKAGDSIRILAHFAELGYEIEIEDDRWLSKVKKGNCFFDVIFASANGAMPIGDTWFENAQPIDAFGTRVWIVGATELVFSKAFVKLRHRYDGADLAHIILKAHGQIDWHRLLGHMEVHWEVLLALLLDFRWIYPTERDLVPDWILDELLDRLTQQRKLPAPRMKVCRGRMFSRIDYEIDVKDWGFADVGGEGEWRPVPEEE